LRKIIGRNPPSSPPPPEDAGPGPGGERARELAREPEPAALGESPLEDLPVVILPDDVAADFFESSTGIDVEAVALDDLPHPRHSSPAVPARPAPPPPMPAPGRNPVPKPAQNPAPPPPPAARLARPAPASRKPPVPRTAPPGQPRPAPKPAPQRPEDLDEELSFDRIEKQLKGDIDDELQSEARHRLSALTFCRAGAFLVAGLLLLLLCIGRSYYILSPAQRTLHHQHALLRPSGPLGLTLGISGALVMVLSLAYLARKSFASWIRIGSLRTWMGFHVVTGLLGPLLVLFHAAFVPTSALGLMSLASAAIVVASGFMGRYISLYVPKSLQGRELEFEVIRRRLTVYRKKLMELGLDPSVLPAEAIAPRRRRAPWLVEAVFAVVWGDRESRREFARLKAAIRARDDLYTETERILILARRMSRERQALVRYRELRKVVDAWRFFHRWLAIVLVVGVFYHVMIGLKFGSFWPLGRS